MPSLKKQTLSFFFKSNLFLFTLAFLSAIVLVIPFFFQSFFFLTWFGLLPLLYAIRKQSIKKVYCLSLFSFFVFVCILSSWIYNFGEVALNLPWYFCLLLGFVFWLYTAHSVILPLVFYHWLKPYFSPLVSLFFFASVMTLSLYIFPFIFPFTLSGSQLAFKAAIQPIDIAGEISLDWIIFLVNIFIFYLVFEKPAKSMRLSLVILPILVVWFAVGIYKQTYWDHKIHSWKEKKKIAIIQPNHPIAFSPFKKEDEAMGGVPKEMQMSQKLLEKESVDFLLWPEGFFYESLVNDFARLSLANQVRELKTPLVYVDIDLQKKDGKEHYYNTSVYMNKTGVIEDKYYKQQLVPFGETFFFFSDIPFIKDLFADFTKDAFTRGTEVRVFHIGNIKATPVLCYESLFPSLVARAIRKEGSQGKILLVQTQDVWYGHSYASQLHRDFAAFRAIENRVPLFHAINNGPSNAFLPNGELIAMSSLYTSESLLITLPFSDKSGGSFFTYHPNLFLTFISLLLAWYSLQVLIIKYRKKKLK